MHLDRTRYLEIELSSGWNEVTNGELHIRAATSGLRLQTSEATVVAGSMELSKKSEVGVVRFGAMNPGSNAKLRLPFNLEHEVNDIALRLEISYTTENGTFFFAKIPSMSIMLPLGVNVQDVFKHKALFSKFTISSATSSPLRLLNSRLEASEVFKAESGTLTTPIVIFPRQPASMLYKITRYSAGTKPRPSSRKDTKSSLSLVLNYVCLEEEIDNAITKDLQQVLKGTPLQPYTRLVIPTVTSEIRAHLSPYDLERIAVLSEIPTSILSTVRWRDHFSGLGCLKDQNQDIATLLAERLQIWQKATPVVPLLPISINEDTIARSRSIIIPVDVPSVTVVHTVDMKLLGNLSLPANTAVAALNQPISASLDLKWTRNWDTESYSENNVSDQAKEIEFFYEVSGASDTWLIGGRRKGHFRVSNKTQNQDGQQKLSFAVVLIPLREGHLPFPNVDIKPAPVAKVVKPGTSGYEEDTARTKQAAVTCETDYKNVGETIRVISDARKTTVSLDASGPQGGAWLLESERRAVESRGADIG
jgi:trafficking protein particle complex subunit 10